MKFLFKKEFAKNPAFRSPPVAHQVPLAAVRDNVYVMADGSMAAVFRVKGLEYDLAGPRDLAEAHSRLVQVLNTVPAGVQLKFLHRVTHNYRDLLEEHEGLLNGKNVFARYIAWDQMRRMYNAMEAGELLRNDNLLVITYNPRVRWWEARDKVTAIKEALSSISDAGAITQRRLEMYQMAVQKFEGMIRPLVDQMQPSGLTPVRLRDQELYDLAWETLNPDLSLRFSCPLIRKPRRNDPYLGAFASRSAQKGVVAKRPDAVVVAPESEREQLCHSDWVVRDSYVKLGGTYYGAVSLRMLPTHVYPGLALGLAGLGFEATVSVDAVMLQKQKELEKQWARARSDESKAQATLFDATPDPAQMKEAQEKKASYMQLAQSFENPFRLRVTIVVSGETPEMLDARCERVITLLREMDSAVGIRERYAVDALVKSTWPFHPITDINSRRAKSTEVASFLPLYDRWAGSVRPVSLLMDPLKRLVRHDPFPHNQLSRNKIVCGKSGSGKSFMTQLADVQPHAALDKTEILIVESGGSFEFTTRLFGGMNLKLGPSCPYTINAFDLPPGFDEMSEEDQEKELRYKYGFIKNLVLEMARIVNVDQQMVAENVVGVVAKRTYDAVDKPRLRDFYRLLGEYKNPKDQAAEELAGALMTRLANYVVTPSGEEGIYARYFDTHTNFDADAPIICFDLIDVKGDDALLRPLMMVTLLGLIYNRIMKRDGTERLVIVDEAWALIKPPKGGGESPAGQAIQLFWREGRKLGASSCMISQNYSDMDGDDIGKAVVANSPIRYFLVHQRIKANDDSFRDADFSKEKRERVYNLETKYGEYSEILLEEGDEQAVVRLPSAGLKYWLATTDPKDLDVRRRYMEKFKDGYGLDEKVVIAILAEDYPGGAHADRPEPMSEQDALAFAEQWKDHYRRFEELVLAGKRIPPDFV